MCIRDRSADPRTEEQRELTTGRAHAQQVGFFSEVCRQRLPSRVCAPGGNGLRARRLNGREVPTIMEHERHVKRGGSRELHQARDKLADHEPPPGVKSSFSCPYKRQSYQRETATLL